MMYVSGETAEASAETTGIIEEIVRQQVIEMVGLMYHLLSTERSQLTEYSFDNVPSKLHAEVADRSRPTT